MDNLKIDIKFRLNFGSLCTSERWRSFAKSDNALCNGSISFLIIKERNMLELRELDLPFYDPMMIIEKTEGRMAEDDFWIRIER